MTTLLIALAAAATALLLVWLMEMRHRTLTAAKDEKLREQKDSLEAKELQLQRWQQQANESEKATERLTATNEMLTAQQKRWEAEAQQREATLAQLQGENKQLAAAAESSQRENKLLHEQAEQNSKAIAQKEELLQQLQAANKQLTATAESNQRENGLLHEQLAKLQENFSQKEEQLAQLQTANKQQTAAAESNQRENKMLHEQLAQLQDNFSQKEAQLSQLQTANKHLASEFESSKKEIEMLRQQVENDKVTQENFWNQKMETLREEMKNATTKMMDQTSDQLHSRNKETMEQLTTPINQAFNQLKKAIDDNNTARTDMRSSLTTQLQHINEQAGKMEQTANRLTNALRGDNKTAGDWGEFVLGELLDSQGLRKGIDYDVQETLTKADGTPVINEDTGKAMRPDVILHYPDKQDVIIDSKVSIRDYYDYVNEQNETLKRTYLAAHVQSLRKHAEELSKKDYSKYSQQTERRAVDFVIMFVPVEGAVQAALTSDPKLWKDAFDRKVFITSTQNLFAILRMIQIAWRQHDQTENQNKIMGMAEELLSRVGIFAKRVKNTSDSINALRTNFDEMMKSVNGRKGILQKANQMKKLGVAEDPKHPIKDTEESLLPEAVEEEQ